MGSSARTGRCTCPARQPCRSVRLLTRNPDYFEPGLPKIDKVEFRIIPDFSTAVAGLERGELDIVWGLPPEHMAKLKDSPSAHVEEVQTGSWEI